MRLLVVTQKMDKNDPILGFFHRWVEEFAKHCERVTVICLQKGEYVLPSNVEVLSLGKEKGGSYIRRTLRYIVRFYGYIWRKRGGYDAVFVHMNPIYVVLGGFLWRLWRKKIALWYTHKSVTASLRVAEQFAHIIFTASRESFRLESGKVRIMGHGIDVKHFSFKERTPIAPVDGREFRIVTIGRISPAKDHETLIEAVRIASKRLPHMRLAIAGGVGSSSQTQYLKFLQGKAEEGHLSGIITFRGPIPHGGVVLLLHESDLFINMSRTGSLDKAVLEAMAAGTPVLTSNEAFRDYFVRDGLLFREGDAAQLAEKLEAFARGDLLVDTRKMRRLVEEKHDLDRLIKTITEILKQ